MRKAERSKTEYVSSEMDSIEQMIEQLKQKKIALEKKSLEEKKSSDMLVVNGEKYVLKGNTMERVVEAKRSPKTTGDVCLDFCKYGKCNRPNCPNRHDRSLVRLCPAFLRVRVGLDINCREAAPTRTVS